MHGNSPPRPATRLVFISYSSIDGYVAGEIDAALRLRGVCTFLDTRDIKPGESIPHRVYEGLGEASHVVALLSQNSVTSKWVQEEFDFTRMRSLQSDGPGVSLIPIRIDDAPLPTPLRHIKYLDMRNAASSPALRETIQELLAVLGVVARSSEDVWSWLNKYLEALLDGMIACVELSEFLSGMFIAGQCCYSSNTPEVVVDAFRMGVVHSSPSPWLIRVLDATIALQKAPDGVVAEHLLLAMSLVTTALHEPRSVADGGADNIGGLQRCARLCAGALKGFVDQGIRVVGYAG